VELIIALDNGYILTHIVYLAWLPLPIRNLAFPLRTKEYGMPVLRPWSGGEMEYNGLCTH
jgi:hypothetical protein